MFMKEFHMKSYKKLFFGLLTLSVFFGACLSVPSQVKDIPSTFFEENRGEGERLVYVTVETDVVEVSPGGTTSLFIVTDNTAIENLTNPYTRVSPAGNIQSPSVQNSVQILERGLAVFSLPKSQDSIGLSYFCSAPSRTDEVATGVSLNTEIVYTNGHGVYRIDPEAGDIAIRIILSPSSNESPQALSSTSSGNIQQMISGCNQYGSPWGTGTPGFIAFP